MRALLIDFLSPRSQSVVVSASPSICFVSRLPIKKAFISVLMKRASITISALVAIISVLVSQSRLFGALNQATARIVTLYNSYTELAPSLDTGETVPTAKDSSTKSERQLISDDMSIPRAIRKVFLAVEQAEGAGARVRRSVGTPQLRNFSPFLMLDHFSVKPGAGFPDQ